MTIFCRIFVYFCKYCILQILQILQPAEVLNCSGMLNHAGRPARVIWKVHWAIICVTLKFWRLTQETHFGVSEKSRRLTREKIKNRKSEKNYIFEIVGIFVFLILCQKYFFELTWRSSGLSLLIDFSSNLFRFPWRECSTRALCALEASRTRLEALRHSLQKLQYLQKFTKNLQKFVKICKSAYQNRHFVYIKKM